MQMPAVRGSLYRRAASTGRARSGKLRVRRGKRATIDWLLPTPASAARALVARATAWKVFNLHNNFVNLEGKLSPMPQLGQIWALHP